MGWQAWRCSGCWAGTSPASPSCLFSRFSTPHHLPIRDSRDHHYHGRITIRPFHGHARYGHSTLTWLPRHCAANKARFGALPPPAVEPRRVAPSSVLVEENAETGRLLHRIIWNALIMSQYRYSYRLRPHSAHQLDCIMDHAYRLGYEEALPSYHRLASERVCLC